MEMILLKALKHKNRVAQKLTQTSNDIREHNCILSVNEPEVDIMVLTRKRLELIKHLVDLKTTIHRASDPVRDKIFMQSELRSSIQFYRSIDTKHGKRQANRYGSSGDDFVEYTAVLRKDAVDICVADLETRIDDIQDFLDEFNAKTKIVIDIPDAMIPAGK